MGEFLPILIAIVFGIYSFYKKNFAEQPDEEKRKPFVPPNLDPMHPKHYGNQKPAKEYTPPQQAPIQTSMMEAYEKSKEKLEQKKNEIYQPQPEVQRVFDPVKRTIEVKKSGLTHMPKFTKKRLVEGVIMAEVLGPPRAHRSHQSNRAKKLSR